MCVSTEPHSHRGAPPKSATLLTLAEVAVVGVYTGRAGVCLVLTPSICQGRREGEGERVSPAVAAARRAAVLQQGGDVGFSQQPGVAPPQHPQQAAHTQALHALPPPAQPAPDGGERAPRHQAPLSVPPHR